MGLKPSLRLILAAMLLAAAGTGFVVSAAEPIKDSACLDCHSDKTLFQTNAAGKGISMYVDEARLKASVHKTNSCVSCHADITSKHPDDNVAAKPPACASCHATQSESYGASVHGLALASGRKDAATCTDCHDGHTIVPPSSPQSPLHFSRLAETCGTCHDQQAKDVEESVHGKAVAEGQRFAPTCTDCHSEHKIVALKNTSTLNTADICSKCHASEKLNTRYRLPADRVKTFFDSYHGLAAQYGSTLAANCSSCHGVHKILPSTDPNSSIHKDHLVETCGKCHPGASENFAQSKIHVDVTAADSGKEMSTKVNWWVRRIYLFLIFWTLGVSLAHNGLLFTKKVAARYRAADLNVLRMNFGQRAQHIVLVLSFIMLAVTGFALRFPDSWLAKALGASEPFRRWSHRVSGVVLLLLGIYHIYYVLCRKEGRQLLRDLLPVPKDAKDLATNARYLTGLSGQKARIGRFGYAEKIEYWAVVWGTIVMGATGLMMWFKMDVTLFLPRWLVDVAHTIHFYEAVLACLAILVWHFYHVIFDPDIYPLNWACWNGKVSKHWMEDEHALVPPPGPAAELPPGKAPEKAEKARSSLPA